MFYNANLYSEANLNSQRHGGQRSTSVTFSTPKIPGAGVGFPEFLLDTYFSDAVQMPFCLPVFSLVTTFHKFFNSSSFHFSSYPYRQGTVTNKTVFTHENALKMFHDYRNDSTLD